MRLASALLCAVTATALAGPPSKTLERAIKLYDRKDYTSATIELQKVIGGEAGDDDENRERAMFFVGKSLFHLGYYVPSYSVFDQITQKGASHRYYTATIKWYLAIAEHLPVELGNLGKFTAKDVQDPALATVQDQISYRRGMFALHSNKLDVAARELAAVPKSSTHYGSAMLALGFVKLRGKKPGDAVATFAGIPAGDAAADLAALASGQHLVRDKKWEAALAAYARVGAKSPLATRAAWEASWATLAKQGKAPAKLATVATTPILSPDGPESPTLFGAVAFDFCSNKQGLDALAGFRADATAIEKQLQTILADSDDAADFYTKHVTKLRGGTAKTLSPRLQMLAHLALNGPLVNRRAALLTEVERELAVMQASDKAWQTTQIAANVLTDLTLARSLAEADVGAAARERLRQLGADLATLRRASATKVVVSAPGGAGLAVLCP
jgi:hypothetical protein